MIFLFSKIFSTSNKVVYLNEDCAEWVLFLLEGTPLLMSLLVGWLLNILARLSCADLLILAIDAYIMVYLFYGIVFSYFKTLIYMENWHIKVEKVQWSLNHYCKCCHKKSSLLYGGFYLNKAFLNLKIFLNK